MRNWHLKTYGVIAQMLDIQFDIRHKKFKSDQSKQMKMCLSTCPWNPSL
ncbi:MAG: hypothetical protein ACI88A_003988 [Paraglaciecola sp.]|jgi:hypothetical protein